MATNALVTVSTSAVRVEPVEGLRTPESVVADVGQLHRELSEPHGAKLAELIERTRFGLQELGNELHRQLHIGFQRLPDIAPSLVEHGYRYVADILEQFHERARAVLDIAHAKAAFVRSNLDQEQLQNDTESEMRKGIPGNEQVFNFMVEWQEAPLHVEQRATLGGETIGVDMVGALPTVKSISVPFTAVCMEALNDVLRHQLVLDVVSIDSPGKRSEAVKCIVAFAIAKMEQDMTSDPGRKEKCDAMRSHEQELNTFLTSFVERLRGMKDSDHPNRYHGNVSNHVLVGLLAEAVNLDGDNPDARLQSFNTWREARAQGNGPVPDGCAVEVYNARRDRRKALRGSMLVYTKSGKVVELQVTNTSSNGNGSMTNPQLVQALQNMLRGSNPDEQPVGAQFIDANELAESILALPTNRGAFLKLYRRTSANEPCYIFRDENGRIQIDDGSALQGKPPKRPSNIRDLTDEQVLSSPIKHFDPRRMQLIFQPSQAPVAALTEQDAG